MSYRLWSASPFFVLLRFAAHERIRILTNNKAVTRSIVGAVQQSIATLTADHVHQGISRCWYWCQKTPCSCNHASRNFVEPKSKRLMASSLSVVTFTAATNIVVFFIVVSGQGCNESESPAKTIIWEAFIHPTKSGCQTH